jgi:hypothetical protein
MHAFDVSVLYLHIKLEETVYNIFNSVHGRGDLVGYLMGGRIFYSKIVHDTSRPSHSKSNHLAWARHTSTSTRLYRDVRVSTVNK